MREYKQGVWSMAYFDQGDVEKNRVLGGLGYLIFFLPFITCPDSRFGKACANQGLIGLIAILAIRLAFWLLDLILGWIPVVGWIVWIAGIVVEIAFGVVWFQRVFLAVTKGEFKPLPYIGNYEILK